MVESISNYECNHSYIRDNRTKEEVCRFCGIVKENSNITGEFNGSMDEDGFILDHEILIGDVVAHKVVYDNIQRPWVKLRIYDKIGRLCKYLATIAHIGEILGFSKSLTSEVVYQFKKRMDSEIHGNIKIMASLFYQIGNNNRIVSRSEVLDAFYEVGYNLSKDILNKYIETYYITDHQQRKDNFYKIQARNLPKFIKFLYSEDNVLKAMEIAKAIFKYLYRHANKRLIHIDALSTYLTLQIYNPDELGIGVIRERIHIISGMNPHTLITYADNQKKISKRAMDFVKINREGF